MRHRYLNHERVVERLLELHKAGKQIILAVDFDNTLYDYHGSGLDCSEVIEIIRRAKRALCYVIIWTGNPDLEFVKQYLSQNHIPYDAVNEQAPFLPDTERSKRKIYCNILLDDVAGLESAYFALDSYLNLIGEKS